MISAFPFENHLQKIKKLVKNSHNTIAQVAKRLSEVEKAQSRGIIDNGLITRISTKRKDRCFMLTNENFAFLVEKRANGQLACDVSQSRT